MREWCKYFFSYVSLNHVLSDFNVYQMKKLFDPIQVGVAGRYAEYKGSNFIIHSFRSNRILNGTLILEKPLCSWVGFALGLTLSNMEGKWLSVISAIAPPDNLPKYCLHRITPLLYAMATMKQACRTSSLLHQSVQPICSLSLIRLYSRAVGAVACSIRFFL